ncbi:lysine-specific demethylase 2A [Lates japonicus]|uniref:Lysine-specific demethylase 2A n=1 Tax=Lates japonicus TaxID=270547 RepID=A0AAD3N9C0_LATJO|nr:lysine-specific demethylase 2A [Lates japonicus]
MAESDDDFHIDFGHRIWYHILHEEEKELDRMYTQEDVVFGNFLHSFNIPCSSTSTALRIAAGASKDSRYPFYYEMCLVCAGGIPLLPGQYLPLTPSTSNGLTATLKIRRPLFGKIKRRLTEPGSSSHHLSTTADPFELEDWNLLGKLEAAGHKKCVPTGIRAALAPRT